ncbi:MAG TPA: Uma2 family endonuclease [Desulfuromonadales bacterium]|nr:Uma2 family endonuclease [Desulfuromonadales bacterium]
MAASPSLKQYERFTYADYLTWPDDERWEIIDGVAYAMSPAPGSLHQRISMDLSRQFATFLKGKTCKVYAAPFDVRLAEQSGLTDDKIETVVQPDIVIICDANKIDNRGSNGPPDLIIEILSPSSAAFDLKQKFELYQRHHVKEYWIIHPAEMTVFVYNLSCAGIYESPKRYAQDDKIPVSLLGELVIDLAEAFAE